MITASQTDKNISLITIRMKNNKCIDIVKYVKLVESEYYVTFKNLLKIKRYIRVNDIVPPVNEKTFKELVKLNMIGQRNGSR